MDGAPVFVNAAPMREALGSYGVSVEGGGGFVVAEHGLFHFLFQDGLKRS